MATVFLAHDLRHDRPVALKLLHPELVHRDIKPGNILLSRGHAVVADFGIAQALQVADAEPLTSTGMALGTPAYMSPEQADGASSVDGRSDLYSLGCVLYEMLAGEVPYTGRTPQAVIAKRVLEPLPHVRTLRESVPPAVERVINRALAVTPADRFASRRFPPLPFTV
jgi:serine/threonine protein kinase